MHRHATLSELFWAKDAESDNLAKQWAATAAVQALDLTWKGFEQLRVSRLSRIDFSQPLEQVERDLARNHCVEITSVWARETSGYSSLVPIHEYPELESRSSAPAKPPAIDLGFAHRENLRWHWSIEAKVVRDPTNLTLYMGDVHKFVSGVAAPLVGEGGLIAYLLSGKEEDLFAELEVQLGQTLAVVTEFSARAHRASSHDRVSFPHLRLHHMAMNCRAV